MGRILPTGGSFPLQAIPRATGAFGQAADVAEDDGFGKTLLTGLAALGRGLDIGTGAAFIRNIVGGEFGKALETLPVLGLFTAPDRDYAVSGKDLLQGLGLPRARISDALPFLFGRPGSGSLIEKGGFWDFTARGTAGFMLEMALDPATYVGIGAMTRTGKALRLLGRDKAAVQQVLNKAAREGIESLPKAQRAAVKIVEALPEAERWLRPTLPLQVEAGQRGLLALDIPFVKLGGPRIPVPFMNVEREVNVFSGLSKVGKAIRGSGLGKLFLNRPGSSTGFQNYNEMLKTVTNRFKGAGRFEKERAHEIANEILGSLKVTNPRIEKNPDELIKAYEGLMNAWEMTDTFKKLPREQRTIIESLRGAAEEIFERDIGTGVDIRRLGEATSERILAAERQVDLLKKNGIGDQADILVDKMVQEQRIIETFDEKILHETELAKAGSERALIDNIHDLELQAERAANYGTDPRVTEITGITRGLDNGLKRLMTQYEQAQRKWLKAAKVSQQANRKSRKLMNAETELRTIERSLQRQRRLVETAQERLAKAGKTAEAKRLERARKIIIDAERQQVALGSLRRSDIKSLRDIMAIEGVDNSVVGEAIAEAKSKIWKWVRTRDSARSRFDKIQRGWQRILLEIDPRLVDMPDALVSQLRAEFPMVKNGLVPEIKMPPVMRELQQTQRRVNQMADRALEEIDNLAAQAPKVDYYAPHIVTRAGREYLEQNFPTMYRGAGAMWTTDHASTLQRTLPWDIHTVNEKMRPVLEGREFFEVNPGAVLLTRAMRTRRAEALTDYARGITQLDGVSETLDDAAMRALRMGARQRRTVRGVVEEVPEGVTVERMGELLDDVRGKVDPETGAIVRAPRGRWHQSLDELDQILARSELDLRVPGERKVREIWRRQGIDPVVVPKEIAEDTAVFGRIMGMESEAINSVLQAASAWTRPWKQFTLFFWPSYYSRNFFSEHFLNWVQGMRNPQQVAKHSYDAYWLNMMEIKQIKAKRLLGEARASGNEAAVRRATKESMRVEEELAKRTFSTRYGQVTGSDILEQYRINGLDDGYGAQAREHLDDADNLRARGEVLRELGRAKKRPNGKSSLWETARAISRDPIRATEIGRKYESVVNKISSVVNVWSEKHPRMAQFLWELETQGRSFDDAGLQVVKRHYDYNSIAFTGFENKILSTVIPFYRWTRSNTPEMFKQFVGIPRRTTAIVRATESQFGDAERNAMAPFMRESVKLRLANNQIIHRIGLPFEDLLEWYNDPLRKLATSIHPAGQEAVRQVTGIDPFLGRPPQPFLGDGADKLPAPAEVLARSLGGRISSTLRRWRQVGHGRLEPITAGLAEVTGIKPRPFDPERAQIQQLRDKVQSLIKEGRVREINVPYVPRTSDDPEASATVKQFSQLTRAMAAQRREELVEAGEVTPTAARKRPRRKRRKRRKRRTTQEEG